MRALPPHCAQEHRNSPPELVQLLLGLDAENNTIFEKDKRRVAPRVFFVLLVGQPSNIHAIVRSANIRIRHIFRLLLELTSSVQQNIVK